MAMASPPSPELEADAARPSRYESQKRRDWQTFTRYLAAHRPPLVLRRCSGAHVLEFLRYLDRFGKTRVHAPPCPAYGGHPAAAACRCPLRQAWGSLDALVGRLRAAFDEGHGRAGGGGENPFAARAVRLYLRDVRDGQARARGISYHKKKKKKKKNKKKGKAAAAPSTSTDGGGHVPTAPAPAPGLPPCLPGVPFECCDVGGGATGGGCYGGLYLPLLFNAPI